MDSARPPSPRPGAVSRHRRGPFRPRAARRRNRPLAKDRVPAVAHVLIADDEDGVRRALSPCAWRGPPHGGGGAGPRDTERAEALEPDLVLLDLRIDGDGLSILLVPKAPRSTGGGDPLRPRRRPDRCPGDEAGRGDRPREARRPSPCATRWIGPWRAAACARNAIGSGRRSRSCARARSWAAPRHPTGPGARRAGGGHPPIHRAGDRRVRGRRTVARAIHEQSDVEGPFVALNCAGRGPARGGALRHEPGPSRRRPQGTRRPDRRREGGNLFLDELGELRRACRRSSCASSRSGPSRAAPSTSSMDARIVASTNRDLMEMVEAGTFREDLFYRLNVFSIVAAPPGQAGGRVPLAHHFLEQFAENSAVPSSASTPALSPGSRPRLARQRAELRNAVERAAILTTSGSIDAAAVTLGAEAGAPRAVTTPRPCARTPSASRTSRSSAWRPP